MGTRFSEVGAPAAMAKLWFATLLRDGFALAASADNGSFAAIGANVLRELLGGVELNHDLDGAVDHIMNGMAGLELHPDVPTESGHSPLPVSDSSP
ncbi:haloacid dehalogenase, type II [Arthrobacter sp. Hiyo4]|nr:haloacid dehalogenase, type II [Arthrobacter sp. Hiyo4]